MKNDISPTIREIADGINVKSIRSVTQFLEALEKRGLLIRSTGQKRNISIAENNFNNFIDVPVVGSAGCDNLNIFADYMPDGYIKVDNEIAGNKKLFAIKAQGDSMREAGINSGDYVLTEALEKPDDNDIVVAVVDGQAVIKRIKFSKKFITLFPEPIDGGYKPIIVNENNLKICGRVIDIIKKPSSDDDIKYDYITEQ